MKPQFIDMPVKISGIKSKDDTCGDCWGSGWEIQFVKPCSKCKGTGKKQKDI
jgi:DnaJ-class molecular chaperone